MLAYNECELCFREVEEDEIKLCGICDTQLCEDCYEEYEGYCEDCYDRLSKKRTIEEAELWRAFWASKF